MPWPWNRERGPEDEAARWTEALFNHVMRGFQREGPRREAAPGPSPGQGPQPVRGAGKEVATSWYAVVQMTELTEDGARGRVVRGYPSLDEAEQASVRSKGLAVHPWAFDREPPPGMRVEVGYRELEALEREGAAKDVGRQVRVLRWQAEQGVYYNHGLWNERDEAPRVGQLVNFTGGVDYRGEPTDRLVGPLRGVDPGPPEEPQPVVFEMSRKTPGLGRVVMLPPSVEDAKSAARELDQARLQQERVMSRFNSLDVGSGLRHLARQLSPDAPP